MARKSKDYIPAGTDTSGAYASAERKSRLAGPGSGGYHPARSHPERTHLPLGGPRTAAQDAANARILAEHNKGVASVSEQFRQDAAERARAAAKHQSHLNSEHNKAMDAAHKGKAVMTKASEHGAVGYHGKGNPYHSRKDGKFTTKGGP